MDESYKFLGSGIALPFKFDNNNDLKINKYNEHVKQSIKVILSTSKGERVNRYNFGCDLQSLVFLPYDTTTKTLLKNTIEEALDEFEPRIDLIDIDIEYMSKKSSLSKLNININYVVKETNKIDNLVFPFYLEGV